MEKFKLTKKDVVMLFAGVALSFTITKCAMNKNETNINQTQAEEITQYYQNEELLEQIGNDVTTVTEYAEEKVNENRPNPDETINSYLSDLREGFNELQSYASDQWNSEEFQAKLAIYKQRLKDLLDFVFNGKEINGITFNDLSEEAKQNVMESIYELDGWIEYLFPDYKQRIHDWLVGLGADGVELWNNLSDGFSGYADEVMDEYNSRKSLHI